MEPHVHHVAAAPLHAVERLVGTRHVAHQVGADGVLRVFQALLLPLVAVDGGVVHQHVQAAQALVRLAEQPAHAVQL
jgi:hypothetical protein